jgi:hypothetical protein
VNYVQGQAFIDGQAVSPAMIGSAQLQPNQSLATQNGKAEILLTPGVFLRLGAGASLRMVSPNPPTMLLERGHAIVEADQADHVVDHSNVQVQLGGATIHIEKHGLYDFNAISNAVRVFDGKAVVMQAGRKVDVDGGHEVFLTSGPFKAQKFDRNVPTDDLYQWSQGRSGFLAEANVGVAQAYVPGAAYYGLSPWNGDGWYWNPWYSAYTFIPGDGIFFSPFGWGFYSPILVYRAPIRIYPGYGHAFAAGFQYGHGAFGHAAFGHAAAVSGRGFAGGGYSRGFARGFAGHGGGGHGR